MRLHDAGGTPIADYRRLDDEGRAVTDLHVPVERAVPAMLAQWRGLRVSAPEPLGRALAAAGATPVRHAHVYSHDLRERPAVPEGFAFTPADRPANELLPAYRAAFRPGHPDQADADGHNLAGILAGELGRLLEASGLVVAGDGRVLAGILVTETDGTAPFTGPWVMELFRDPSARGTGRALLERALALTPPPALGLTVTDGNPAIGLYRTLGFRRVYSIYSVKL
jgi:GNAT superfamily N-acetyltransferase